METGRTVILLNLENLYESLYDALNQVSLVKLTNSEYCWLRLVDHSYFDNVIMMQLMVN